jgi:septum formation protein
MLHDKISGYNVILASASPRRKMLLEGLGISFTFEPFNTVDESFPDALSKFEIPVYLAEKKSRLFPKTLKENDLLITADTIVWLNNTAINKPVDRNDAIRMLTLLSGNMHEVVTGVTLRSAKLEYSFYSHSEVFFSPLKQEEICYYVDHYSPYDKAGAYGIQEWIGYVGISEIRGSYFNVMGLPVQKLYHELERFIDEHQKL